MKEEYRAVMTAFLRNEIRYCEEQINEYVRLEETVLDKFVQDLFRAKNTRDRARLVVQTAVRLYNPPELSGPEVMLVEWLMKKEWLQDKLIEVELAGMEEEQEEQDAEGQEPDTGEMEDEEAEPASEEDAKAEEEQSAEKTPAAEETPSGTEKMTASAEVTTKKRSAGVSKYERKMRTAKKPKTEAKVKDGTCRRKKTCRYGSRTGTPTCDINLILGRSKKTDENGKCLDYVKRDKDVRYSRERIV